MVISFQAMLLKLTCYVTYSKITSNERVECDPLLYLKVLRILLEKRIYDSHIRRNTQNIFSLWIAKTVPKSPVNMFIRLSSLTAVIVEVLPNSDYFGRWLSFFVLVVLKLLLFWSILVTDSGF